MMKNFPEETLPEKVCPNCGNPIHGTFCFSCGQNQKDLNRFFLSLVSEAFEDIFSFKSRVSLTLFHLFFRPGFISDEYSRGRRARYVPPLRLYLITSVIFVLLLSLQSALEQAGSSLPIQINSAEPEPDKLVVLNHDKKMTDEDIDAQIDSDFKDMDLAWLTEEQASDFQDITRQQAKKVYRIYKDDPSRFVEIILDTLPPMMFVLLPLFALLLKLTYLFSGRYYTEHLVFALHNHCFVYIATMLIQLLEMIESPGFIASVAEWLAMILSVWIAIYLVMSLKFFYAQGYTLTILKSMFLSVMYSILLLFALALAAIWGFFTL